MKLIKFSIIVFVLMVGPSMGKLEIANSYQGKLMSRLANELGNILKCSYGDQIPGVGIAGNLPNTLSRILTVQHLIPVVRFDRHMKLNNMPRHLTNDFRYKLHVFILEGYTTQRLDDLIGKMEFSVWWNHMASFFILDLSRGCGNAKDFLLLAWKHNVLNAKVMCRPRRSERSIFNYNPFTSQAPVSWQRTAVFPSIHKHPFTLFSRKYKENETICADLDFEKTKELGRYRIIVEGQERKHLKVAPGEVLYEHAELHIKHQYILRNVFRTLNATVTYNGKGRYWTVITETDMIADTLSIRNTRHKKMSYITDTSGRNIVTQYRNREPRRFNESFTVRGIDTWFGTPIVYLITLLVFKFFVDQALVPTLFNLIRVSCITSFINLRDMNSMRMYLTDVGFFVVIMQAIFYANLTYPLTQQIPLRNVDTVQDLMDLGYTNVMGDRTDPYFWDFIPPNVTKTGTIGQCLRLIKNTKSIACMHDLLYQRRKVEQNNLHASRKFYVEYYMGFPIRSNWPLEVRVNIILARLMEANAFQPWCLKFNSIRTRSIRKGETDRNNRNVESIKLGEITFVFIFLVIGHMCATVVFMIEFSRTYEVTYKIHFVRRYWSLKRKKNGCLSLRSSFDLTV